MLSPLLLDFSKGTGGVVGTASSDGGAFNGILVSKHVAPQSSISPVSTLGSCNSCTISHVGQLSTCLVCKPFHYSRYCCFFVEARHDNR